MRLITVLSLVTFGLLPSLLSQTADPEPFYELNGIVVMEAESIPIADEWSFETAIPGFSGTGYLVGTLDTFNQGGKGRMRFPIQITQAGRYQLSWKSRITEGDSNTDFNDSFARLTDAEGNPIDTVPNENVKIGDWYKVYMNRSNQWSYDARNKDNDPHSLSWNLEADTLYYFEISVRSKGHGLDRIVLWDRVMHSFGDLITGSSRGDEALDLLPVSPQFAVVDEDEDGLPDGWERGFGELEPDIQPESDEDGDGRNAVLEFVMGTDPTVRERVLDYSIVEADGLTWANFEYTYSAVANLYYDIEVEYSVDLEEWRTSGLREDLLVEDLGGNQRKASARIRVSAQRVPPFFRLRAVEKE